MTPALETFENLFYPNGNVHNVNDNGSSHALHVCCCWVSVVVWVCIPESDVIPQKIFWIPHNEGVPARQDAAQCGG